MFYVYFFYDINDNVIYIGKTKRDINDRMREHFGPYGHLSKECYSKINKITYYTFLAEKEMDIAEAYLINKHNPYYNKKKESFSKLELNAIKNKIEKEKILKGDLIWQASLIYNKGKQKILINQMFLKLKNTLKNLKLKI